LTGPGTGPRTAPGSRLGHPAIQRVRQALRERGSSAEVIALAETARTAEAAANALGVPLGAIVKSLVFTIDGAPVMALIAGDRRCATRALPGALGMAGLVARADADRVRQVTGFAIGGVAPLGHPARLPTAIDASLARFETVYAAAGHPFAVFPTTMLELSLLTGGAVVKGISADGKATNDQIAGPPGPSTDGRFLP
jgi:prolyl-tRNA editing enzyme YbaK/EbsC (Cys-tRNA(Pro) deacylase)